MAKQAFDAARLGGFRFDPDKLVIVGLDTKDGPEHELYDERAFDGFTNEMVLSLMGIGCQSTITVCKGPKGEPYVVDGRGRVLAGREANTRLKKLGEPLITIPAMSVRGDENMMAHVMVATNEVRRPDDLLVKVTKLQRMLARNPDKKGAAIAFGVTPTTIANWLKIADLPVAVKKVVASGAVAASTAAKLHGMPKKDQLAELEKIAVTHAKTGKKVTTSKVNGKAGKTEPISRPSAKTLGATMTALKAATKDEKNSFQAGVVAGMQYALGMDRKDVQKLLGAK